MARSHRVRSLHTACLAVGIAWAGAAGAATYNVNSDATLRTALLLAGNGDVINFTGDVVIAGSDLPALRGNVTVNGNGQLLSGANAFRGLFVYSGTVSISNLAIVDTLARGGNGGDAGGGGGAGLGGGLFVASGANVTLSGVRFKGNAAAGGAGSYGDGYVGAGGGGLGGNGGNGNGGGGGGIGSAATGATPVGGAGAATAGASGIVGGALAGGAGSTGALGGSNGGGGGSGPGTGNGGGGGIGATAAGPNNAGNGGFGGGGGGSGSGSTVVGGNGGFGGGGGASIGTAGRGGFGGGGGGSIFASGGDGGFAGGAGGHGGGGGAALGGAIFVMQGGSLTFGAASSAASVGTVTGGGGGSGAGSGQAYGAGMFLQGDGSIAFAPAPGQTHTFADAIADQTGSGGAGANAGSWRLLKKDTGTLVLSGANTYSGGTEFNGGVVRISSAANLGSGPLIFGSGTLEANLSAQDTALFTQAVTFTPGAGNFLVDAGMVQLAGPVAGSNGLVKTGNGTLTLSGNGIAYSGPTEIQAGRLVLSGRLVSDVINVRNSGVLRIDLAVGGDVNGATVNVYAGGALETSDNLTYTNLATLSVQGGNIKCPLVNLGQMDARGTVADFANQSDASLTGQLNVTGNLSNFGTLSLNGMAIAGAGTLDNQGSLNGPGTVTIPAVNTGLIHATGGATLLFSQLAGNTSGGQITVDTGATLRLLAPLDNAGAVTLAGGTLSGDVIAITNTGTVAGSGIVQNRLANGATGTLRADAGGTLTITGAGGTNAGLIAVEPGATLRFNAGLAQNDGVIALNGGTFDNNGLPLINAGTIAGNGSVRTGGMTVDAAGTISVADAPANFYGGIVNGGSIDVANSTATFYGAVTNGSAGTIKNTTGTVRFLSTFTNNGTYTSDPADNYFASLELGSTGALIGGAGDHFTVSGDFTSASGNPAWNTSGATLRFNGAGSHLLDFSAHTGLLSFGTVAVDSGNTLTINGPANGELVVQTLDLQGSATLASGLIRAHALAFAPSAPLDLTDNEMVLNDADSSAYAAYVALIRSGTIFTSADQPNAVVALVDNSALHITSWHGATISNGIDFGQLLFAHTYAGDNNLDGLVDQQDYVNVIANMGRTNATWTDGDLNGDGSVTSADVAVVTLNLGSGSGGSFGPPLAAVFGPAPAAVPEPAMLAPLAISLLAIARRRRRVA